VPQFVKAKERRSKGNWSYFKAEPSVLHVPSQLAVCELKLNFDNLFSLPSHEIWLPENLPLKQTERARVSFAFIPVKKRSVHNRGNHIFHNKMTDGFRPYRSAWGETNIFS